MMFNHDQTTRKTNKTSFRQSNLKNFFLEGKLGNLVARITVWCWINVHVLHFGSLELSGPNNGVVLNKRVDWIFCSPFISENACLWKNFKSYEVKKRMWAGFFLGWTNRRVDMLIRTTRVCISFSIRKISNCPRRFY